MSCTVNVTDQVYTFSDEIFCNEMIKKYEAGEEYYVELYNDLNKLFPMKLRDIGALAGKN